MPLTVHQFPCLDDNYAFLVRDEETGEVATIDTPDSAEILAEADRLGWRLTTIYNTHWHPDHAGGNEAIKAATGAVAYGPAEVRAHYPLDHIVVGGDVVRLGQSEFQIIESGGHTLGHIVYYLPAEGLLFAGDTLFPMGCGKLFEGTAEQMWESLSRIAGLPAETTVYSAHEYALANAQFALSVDPGPEVRERSTLIAAARERGQPTVPTTIEVELATNPFLRATALPLTRKAPSAAEAFALVRQAKDQFVG